MTAIFSHQIAYESKAPLKWRHNERDGVSNHQRLDCLLNHLFKLRSKKTSKLFVTGLCEGNSSVPANSRYKGPVTRKMLPFDDVFMICHLVWESCIRYVTLCAVVIITQLLMK